MRASADDILAMVYFARVVEARSFTEAARVLGVSKSSVSTRVARLEETLGVQLLHRTTRRLALTADGVTFYEHCAKVVLEADEAAEMGARASTVPRGRLRIHAPASLGPYVVMILERFRREHADVRIELRLSDQLPEAPAERVDLALVLAERLPDSDLTTRKLASVPVVVCAAPAYLRRRGIPFRPQDLVHHDAMSMPPAQLTGPTFRTDEGPVATAALSKLTMDDLRTLRDAAVAGLGIAILPDLVVAEDLVTGRLQRVLEEFPLPELGLHVLHPHGQRPPASVRVFLEHVVAFLRDPPWATRSGEVAPGSIPPPARRIALTAQDVGRLTAVAKLYATCAPDAVARLRSLVAAATVTSAPAMPADVVTINSRSNVHDERGHVQELALVYPWDAGDRRLSVLSEVGLELLGARSGDTVLAGEEQLRILGIAYQPEAAGDHHL